MKAVLKCCCAILTPTQTVDGQNSPRVPNANPIDIALKYITYFGTISAKIKPTDAVSSFEGMCQQLLIQNNEMLKLSINSWPQEVLIASVDRAGWSYEGLKSAYLKRDSTLPAVHQSYPVWSTTPAGHRST